MTLVRESVGALYRLFSEQILYVINELDEPVLARRLFGHGGVRDRSRARCRELENGRGPFKRMQLGYCVARRLVAMLLQS